MPQKRIRLFRTVHNKNLIEIVMFLTAVAKPRYDNEGNYTFDGKIGIWPFYQKGSISYMLHFLKLVFVILFLI